MSDRVVVVLTPEYDWKVGVRKGLHTSLTVAGAMLAALLPLALDHFASDGNVAAVLPPKYIALAPFIAGAIRFAVNRRKQQG